MQSLILSLTLVLGVLALSWTTQTRAQDVDIESLAKMVCETTRGHKKQISNVSQVSQLVQFYQGLTIDHKLYPCRNIYLESLEELEIVLNTANGDACGEEKIKLVENFHQKYVSKVSKYVRQQKRGNKAPKMAKLLFMQYVSQLSSICEEAAVTFIEKHQKEVSQEDLAKIDGLRKFTDALGMSDFSTGFTGVYLFWNMVDSLCIEKDKKFSKYIETNGETRLNVQMRDARSLFGVQTLCRNKLKPSYSKSVLPVLRLVDMGYYPKSQRLLADDAKMRPIFLATQICETILPVQVFEDEKLNSDQFVALTKEEASFLVKPREIEGLGKVENIEVAPVSVAHLSDMVSQIVVQIKKDVASRSKIVSKMLRNVVKQLKAKLGSFLGKSVLFMKGENQQLEPVSNGSLDKIDEDQLLQPTEDNNDNDDETGVAGENNRLKRGFWSGLGEFIFFIGYALYLVFLVLYKLVILSLPTILLLIGAAAGSDGAFEMVQRMWKFDTIRSFSDSTDS